MRLIDADKLKETIHTDFSEHFTIHHDTDQTTLIDMVMNDIDETPTVFYKENVNIGDFRLIIYGDMIVIGRLEAIVWNGVSCNYIFHSGDKVIEVNDLYYSRRVFTDCESAYLRCKIYRES